MKLSPSSAIDSTSSFAGLPYEMSCAGKQTVAIKITKHACATVPCGECIINWSKMANFNSATVFLVINTEDGRLSTLMVENNVTRWHTYKFVKCQFGGSRKVTHIQSKKI